MREWMKGQADAALATDTPVMWCEQTQASVCLLLLASGLWLLAVAVAVASTSASFKVFLIKRFDPLLLLRLIKVFLIKRFLCARWY